MKIVSPLDNSQFLRLLFAVPSSWMGKKESKYKKCVMHVQFGWEKLLVANKNDKQPHFGLPHPYICPNTEIFSTDQFYWDSYFTILGLVVDGKVKIARGMVENFIYLRGRNRWVSLDHWNCSGSGCNGN